VTNNIWSHSGINHDFALGQKAKINIRAGMRRVTCAQSILKTIRVRPSGGELNP